MWGELVDADAFDKLSSNGAEGGSALGCAIVDVEDRRLAAKDPTPTERRRYQGTEHYLRALTRLSSFPWSTYVEDVPITTPSPPAATPSPPPPTASSPIVWKDMKQALLQHVAGHGMGPFLADKAILGLLLAGLLTASDGGNLGPGALTVMCAFLQLIRGKGWSSAYKCKPSEVNAEQVAEIEQLLPAFIGFLRPLFRLVVKSYWAARVRRTSTLKQLTPSLLGALDRDHPVILFENMLCELQRRRAAGIAWAQGIVPSLPKGKVKISKLTSGVRTNANLRFLILVETSSGSFVVAVPLVKGAVA